MPSVFGFTVAAFSSVVWGSITCIQIIFFLHMIKNVSFVPFQKDVFQLKDIEKIAPKTKGISEYRQQLFSGNVFFA